MALDPSLFLNPSRTYILPSPQEVKETVGQLVSNFQDLSEKDANEPLQHLLGAIYFGLSLSSVEPMTLEQSKQVKAQLTVGLCAPMADLVVRGSSRTGGPRMTRASSVEAGGGLGTRSDVALSADQRQQIADLRDEQKKLQDEAMSLRKQGQTARAAEVENRARQIAEMIVQIGRSGQITEQNASLLLGVSAVEIRNQFPELTVWTEQGRQEVYDRNKKEFAIVSGGTIRFYDKGQVLRIAQQKLASRTSFDLIGPGAAEEFVVRPVVGFEPKDAPARVRALVDQSIADETLSGDPGIITNHLLDVMYKVSQRIDMANQGRTMGRNGPDAGVAVAAYLNDRFAGAPLEEILFAAGLQAVKYAINEGVILIGLRLMGNDNQGRDKSVPWAICTPRATARLKSLGFEPYHFEMDVPDQEGVPRLRKRDFLPPGFLPAGYTVSRTFVPSMPKQQNENRDPKGGRTLGRAIFHGQAVAPDRMLAMDGPADPFGTPYKANELLLTLVQRLDDPALTAPRRREADDEQVAANTEEKEAKRAKIQAEREEKQRQDELARIAGRNDRAKKIEEDREKARRAELAALRSSAAMEVAFREQRFATSTVSDVRNRAVGSQFLRDRVQRLLAEEQSLKRRMATVKSQMPGKNRDREIDAVAKLLLDVRVRLAEATGQADPRNAEGQAISNTNLASRFERPLRTEFSAPASNEEAMLAMRVPLFSAGDLPVSRVYGETAQVPPSDPAQDRRDFAGPYFLSSGRGVPELEESQGVEWGQISAGQRALNQIRLERERQDQAERNEAEAKQKRDEALRLKEENRRRTMPFEPVKPAPQGNARRSKLDTKRDARVRTYPEIERHATGTREIIIEQAGSRGDAGKVPDKKKLAGRVRAACRAILRVCRPLIPKLLPRNTSPEAMA
jgi:hypothetical protein